MLGVYDLKSEICWDGGVLKAGSWYSVRATQALINAMVAAHKTNVMVKTGYSNGECISNNCEVVVADNKYTLRVINDIDTNTCAGFGGPMIYVYDTLNSFGSAASPYILMQLGIKSGGGYSYAGRALFNVNRQANVNYWALENGVWVNKGTNSIEQPTKCS